jgi:hypothetical protein
LCFGGPGQECGGLRPVRAVARRGAHIRIMPPPGRQYNAATGVPFSSVRRSGCRAGSVTIPVTAAGESVAPGGENAGAQGSGFAGVTPIGWGAGAKRWTFLSIGLARAAALA